MSSSQTSSTMSNNNNNSQVLDPLESFTDFSEYEQVSYQSPAISPSTTKSQFRARSVSNTPAALPSSQPTLSGPSHNYDLYRQHTGIPQGAVANTLAVNSSNTHINSYGFTDSYLSGLSPSEDFLDFGTAPRASFNDMEFDTPEGEPAFFYPESTNEFIDPSAIGANNGLPAATVLPTQAGRLWPGVHQQQAALAKAQAQQKQQQQIIQQQRQSVGGQSRQSSQRPKASHPPADPIVEEKISQLLNSMRQSSVTTEGDDSNGNNNSHVQRMRKDEEDMDEDERLLASEEGKKLSSKERRQLRNKVSARAFRSRRKEYIGQLEGEIAVKVNENTDLRSQNRALMEENTRLSDLTRMLLSSPSFSGFLDTLSQNTVAQPAPTPAPVQQPERQVRKDVNPYAAQQQMQQQQIGMAMIPEHNMDFSMLDLNTDGAFTYQPQVFSVLSLPEPAIDTEVLSGKSSFTPSLPSDDEKVIPSPLERAPIVVIEEEVTEVADEEFDSDPTFALYISTPSTASVSKPQELDITSLIAALPSKPVQYELVAEEKDDVDEAEAAMRKVDRLCSRIDRMADKFLCLTMSL